MDISSTHFSESLLEHESFIQALVRGILSNEEEVEDVVQETWIKALKAPPRFGVPLKAWLARVATNWWCINSGVNSINRVA